MPLCISSSNFQIFRGSKGCTSDLYSLIWKIPGFFFETKSLQKEMEGEKNDTI